MRDVVFAMVISAMCALALTSAPLGVMLWIWTALAIPSSYMYGFLAAVPLNKVTVVVAVIAILFDRHRGKVYVDGFIVLLSLLLAQGLLSYGVRITDIARADDVLDRFYKVILLCYCMTFVPRERLNLHAMVLIVAISGGIHGILEGMKYINSLGTHRMQPVASLGDNNYLALYCVMVCPLFVYLIRYTAYRPLRIAWTGSIVLLSVAVVASSSRGGFLGLLVFGFFLFLHSKRKLLALAGIAVAVVLLLLATPEAWKSRMDTISTAAEADDSFQGRIRSWEMNTLLALDRPLTGGGFSAMENPLVFQQYLPSFERVNLASMEPPTHALAAHSIYFQVLGDLGFPGLFLLLGLLLKTYLNLAWIIRRTNGIAGAAWVCDLARSFRLVLVLYCFCGAALSAPYSEIAYIIFAMASLLRRYVTENLPRPVGARYGLSMNDCLAVPPPSRSVA